MLARKREPATSRYAMRCYVASGSAMPEAPSVARLGKNLRMAVRISIGADALETRMVENNNGVCEVRNDLGARRGDLSAVSFELCTKSQLCWVVILFRYGSSRALF